MLAKRIRDTIGTIQPDIDVREKVNIVVGLAGSINRLDNVRTRDVIAQELADALGIDARVIHHELVYARRRISR